MHNKYTEILAEIDEIIAGIGNYKLSDNQKKELIKSFKEKIQQAKFLSKDSLKKTG